MKNPETRFKEKVIEDLKALPQAWVLKTNEVARRGVPDILASLKGNFIAIELKAEAHLKPEPLQAAVLEKITATGATAFFASPQTWGHQLEVLKRLFKYKGEK